MGTKDLKEFNENLKELMTHKNLKERMESKDFKELMENVQADFTKMSDLTKKMYEGYSDDVRTKILEKTEEMQEKLQQFHDFVQNSSFGQKDQEASEAQEETAEEAAAVSPEEADDAAEETVSGTEEEA